MSFKTSLENILGKQANVLELEAFSFFNSENMTPEKQFLSENESMPLFLNVNDEYFSYVSVKSSAEECLLDLCSRNIRPSFSGLGKNAALMGGVTLSKDQQPSVVGKEAFTIFFLPLETSQITYLILKNFVEISDSVDPVWNESIWERVCQICVKSHSGCHVTMSKTRCFSQNTKGLLCKVKESRVNTFNETAAKHLLAPAFVGKTLSFPVISYDCSLSDMILEIPVSGLEKIMALKKGSRRPEIEIPKAKVMEEEEIEEKIPNTADMNNLMNYLKRKKKSGFKLSYDFLKTDPKLDISIFSSKGLSMSENSLKLLMMKSILTLKAQQKKIVACSYSLQIDCKYPSASKSLLSPLLHTAKLFQVPVSNGLCQPTLKAPSITLFFVTQKEKYTIPDTFQNEGNFITLLGDANGSLTGSAYDQMNGLTESYDPPGVMTGTAAAILDVLHDAKAQGIIHSITPIDKGGLAAALYHACSKGKGAKIYSERKSPKEQFLFGEPQAAVLLTLPEKMLMDFARICSLYNLTSVTIGRVSKENNLDINGWINIIPSRKK